MILLNTEKTISVFIGDLQICDINMITIEKSTQSNYLHIYKNDEIKACMLINNDDEYSINEVKSEFSNTIYYTLNKLQKKAGRPNSIDKDTVIKYKNDGYTQEECSRILNLSISTIRRNWK